MTDFSNVAAAQAAGYSYDTTQEPGDGRFYSRLSKIMRGELGEADLPPMYAEASGATTAEADANVVLALNAQRSARYGFQEPASPSLDDVSGAAEVVDAT